MLGTRGKLTILAVTMGCFAGCGKSEYEDLMKTRNRQLSVESKFLESLHEDETEIAQQATLQLPIYIDTTDPTMFRAGAKDRRGDAISAKRIQPPFLKIPGFQYSYEQFIDLEGRNNTHSVYCYIASVPASDQKQDAILKRIQSEVRRAFKSATFQDVQLDTPDGGKLPAKKLSVRGKQVFETNSEGGDERSLPGQFDLYVHSTPTQHIIVGFRASDELAGNVKVFEKAALCVGTLKVDSGG